MWRGDYTADLTGDQRIKVDAVAFGYSGDVAATAATHLHRKVETMRVVAPAEHYATDRFFEGPGKAFFERMTSGAPQFSGSGRGLVEQLSDGAAGRIAEMDAAGVDIQVLSLTAPGLEQVPATEAVPLAVETNDYLAEAVQHHPQAAGRFRRAAHGRPRGRR